MKNIREIETRLQEYGYETDIYNSFVLAFINRETTARGRIFIVEENNRPCK